MQRKENNKMSQDKIVQLLRDESSGPTEDNLAAAMGEKLFSIYKSTMQLFGDAHLAAEWHFYKDGNAWLCKAQHKNKTVAWLSVWKTYIRLCFYFTEKTGRDIEHLPVSPEVIQTFKEANPVGRLLPLIMDINRKSQLKDLEKIMRYKIDSL